MPTKPVTMFSNFATDANFTSGPANTFPVKIPYDVTQGFIPGNGIAAEHVNYLLRICGEWVDWQNAGTFLPVLDATIVERDAQGDVQIASAQFGNVPASSAVPLTVNDNGSNFFGASAVFFNSVGESAIYGTTNGGGAYAGVEGVSDNGTGVRGTAITGDQGVHGTTGPVAGAALGVFGDSLDAGAGVGGQGGPNGGDGVQGVCLVAAAQGVLGYHNVVGSTTADGAGVRGTATNGAVGVRGTAVDGYGGEFSSTGQRAPLRLTPRSQPAIADDGSFYWDSADKMGGVVNGVQFNRIHDSALGYAASDGIAAAGAFNSGALTTVNSLIFGAPNEIRKAGRLKLSVSFAARNNTANLVAVEVLIRDVTGAPVNVKSEIIYLAVPLATLTALAAGTYERTIHVEAFANVVPGPAAFDVQFRIFNGGAGGIDHTEIVFTAEGMH